MLMIIHALIGSIIGQYSHSVILIIISSLIIHFLIDMIPHWDGTFNNKLFYITDRAIIKKSTLLFHLIDFLCALLLIMFLYHDFHNKLIILGALFSIFPDVMKIGYKTRLRDRKSYMKILRFHSKIQKDISWKIGLIVQAIIILILLMVLF